MPFALLIIGAAFILVGYQGTQAQFFSLLKGDFTGSGNFIVWALAIFVIGAIGYIPKLKPISHAFLVLVLLVIFIKNKGFFQAFNQQIRSGTAATPGTSTPAGAIGAAGGLT